MNNGRNHPRTTIARGFGRAMACAAAGGVLGLAAGPAAGQVVPKERPAPVRGLEIQDKRGETLPLHLQFKDAAGKVVSLGDYFDRASGAGKGKKPVVVQLLYFRCPILCPTVLGKFTETLKGLDFSAGQDFDVLVVSVDHRDTPSDAGTQRANQLASYGRDPAISARGWNYLVGAESARALADGLGFEYRWVPGENGGGEYAHGAALFVLTPDGRVSRTLTGLNYPAKDVRLALLEASDGKIGSVFDRFTLWCYHFNPETGSYSLMAMRVMQAAGGATVLALGGLLGVMFAHERVRRWSGARPRAGGAGAAGAGSASETTAHRARGGAAGAITGRAT